MNKRLICVSEGNLNTTFLQGASDGNARIRRNISPKSKNIEKLDFQKTGFLILFFVRIDAPIFFLEVSTKNPMFKDFFEIMIFMVFYDFHLNKGPPWGQCRR